jgi:hypothetical protein
MGPPKLIPADPDPEPCACARTAFRDPAEVEQAPPLEAARQMALAYRKLLDPTRRLDWCVAALRRREMRLGGNSTAIAS